MTDTIEQLKDYKRIVARIQVLSSYSVGAGITVSRLNEDDQLQELHRRLRGLPTYMYLNKHEQELETVAHAYLTRYPAGTRAQYREVASKVGATEEDKQLLQELKRKIRKVIQARGWDWPEDVFESVIQRIAELQELQEQKQRIDTAMKALESYKPDYAELLRLRYIEGESAEEVARKFNVVRQTLHRWERKAIREMTKLVG